MQVFFLKFPIKTFKSEVGDSESTNITSYYLQEMRDVIETVFEKITIEDETIHDITFAKSATFSCVNDWNKKVA